MTLVDSTSADHLFLTYYIAVVEEVGRPSLAAITKPGVSFPFAVSGVPRMILTLATMMGTRNQRVLVCCFEITF